MLYCSPMVIKNILVVDDELIRHENFVKKFNKMYPAAKIDHAYNYNQCLAALEQGPKYDLVQLDHDLADFGPYPQEVPIEGVTYEPPKGLKEYTGTDIALWMATAKHLTAENKPDMIVIHSHNKYGRERMHGILSDAGFSVFIELFAP